MNQLYILIGKIIAPFGIKGLLKIKSFSDPLTNIFTYKLYINKTDIINISLLHKNKGFFICKEKTITTRNDAEKLRNIPLYVLREDFKKLSEEEFYIADLINLTVIDNSEKIIGKVQNVFNLATIGIEIKFFDGKIVAYPFLKSIFPKITSKTITFCSPEMF